MQVQVLSKEKAKVLAEQYGWSLEFAEGYVDGEAWRGRRKKLPEHASVGIDEYSMGFRAAYFNRKTDLALQLTYDSGTTVTFAGSVNSATQIAAKLTYPNGSSLDTTFLKL